MKTKRRKFTAAFEAKVALSAIQERGSLWQNFPDGVECSSVVFETKVQDDDFEQEREKLYAKIGQLQMERDWLKKT